MIRRLFLLALLAICSHCLFGQSYYHRMDTAIDLGTHSGPFSYEETFDMRIYSDDYSCQKPESDYFSSNDVFFKLTVVTSSIELYSRADCSYIHVLDASGNEIDHIDLGRADYYRGLLPGTYYLVYESSGTDVTIRIRGEERVIGEDFYCPLDLGNFGEEFTVSHTANIAYYEPDYIPGTTPWGYDHDMVYRFTLLQPRLFAGK